ncbi:hypothetical protein C2845_PM01G35590 [Panicum miliaceum]|uniref:Uncharacterized protein n=1 Tax=Panicum miliaceum TaxID=4540 RepID=A0A3L6TH18_PANMI|nr:hypothetical protein C2845_PM01G35590 [Panicum miliaceum]
MHSMVEHWRKSSMLEVVRGEAKRADPDLGVEVDAREGLTRAGKGGLQWAVRGRRPRRPDVVASCAALQGAEAAWPAAAGTGASKLHLRAWEPAAPVPASPQRIARHRHRGAMMGRIRAIGVARKPGGDPDEAAVPGSVGAYAMAAPRPRRHKASAPPTSERRSPAGARSQHAEDGGRRGCVPGSAGRRRPARPMA